MPGGRPTNYDPELLEKARHYATNYEEYGDLIPSVVGLCKVIGRSKAIIYKWRDDEDKSEFLDILNEIEENQHDRLINGGLSGGFNYGITKMILTKHGYSDKIEQLHSSPDGSMTPQPTRIELITPDNDDS